MNKKRSRIYLILTITCMLIIFLFSSRNGDESSGDSYKVGITVARIFISDFDSWDESRQIEFAKKIDYPVRKTAHATEYAVLGFLILGTVYGKSGRKKDVAVSIITGILYASSDEIHQLFVPGRSGKITDVCIDSIGVIAGVLFMLLMFTVITAWNRRNGHECRQ